MSDGEGPARPRDTWPDWGRSCGQKGAYRLEQGRGADSINVETMTRWNKALRARQAAVREDQAREAARRQAVPPGAVDRAI